MKFELSEAADILARTPDTLHVLLEGLSSAWLLNTEGDETWSPYDVIGHLLNAESEAWMVRLDRILEHGEDKAFLSFDRFAHFETSKGKSLEELLEAFSVLRKENVQKLYDLKLSEQDFETMGKHPAFGQVKLRELLATWVVHDLSHIRQIVRTMAKQYETEVGPWKAYLSVFQD